MLDLLYFFIAPPASSLIYTGRYDWVLVLMSVLVASAAAYAALLVSQSMASAMTVASRRLWLLAGSLCLGFGVWAMHFVGMLAFSLPCSTGYDVGITLLSVLPSVVASALALSIISRPSVSARQIAWGGLLLGAGIGGMHYSGMTALRLEGLVRYHLGLFLLSVLVAVALATLAIWLKFRLQQWADSWERWRLPASALVLGLAVSAMHYTAMAAAYFLREGDSSTVDSVLAPNFLAAIVLVVSLGLIVVTVAATYAAKPSLRSLSQSYLIMAALIAVWVALAWEITDRLHQDRIASLYQQALEDTTQRAQHQAAMLGANLKILKAVPAITSDDAHVQQILENFGPKVTASSAPVEQRKQQWAQDSTLRALSQDLQRSADLLQVDQLAVLNAAGDCVAASNYLDPNSCVGNNFHDRVYFRQAAAGQLGHQYALGRTSSVAGFYFAQPVLQDGRFIGAVVVKRNLSSLLGWIDHGLSFISDEKGVVVWAANKSMQFKKLPAASVDLMGEVSMQQTYGQHISEQLKVAPWPNPSFPQLVQLGQSPQPVILVTNVLNDGLITLHSADPILGWAQLSNEKWGFYVLITATGGLLIVSAFSVFLYLREMRRVEADLRISAAAFETQEAMFVTNHQNRILRCNQSFLKQTGYSADEVVGKTPNLLRSDRHAAEFYQAIADTIALCGHWQGETWLRRKNGDVYPSLHTITAIKGKQGWVTHYVAMHSDITERKLAEAEIRRLAFYDPLTLLPNRRLLMDRLDHALLTSSRSAQHGAIFFIDLDNFKLLNDTWGHEQGDKLLQQVASRLKERVRKSDTVARLGGDEFVVMIEGLHENSKKAAQQANIEGEKIMNALNEPYLVNNANFHSTPSVGLTLFMGHQIPVRELLRRADMAMYQAKSAGRNSLRFFDEESHAGGSS